MLALVSRPPYCVRADPFSPYPAAEKKRNQADGHGLGQLAYCQIEVNLKPQAGKVELPSLVWSSTVEEERVATTLFFDQQTNLPFVHSIQ